MSNIERYGSSGVFTVEGNVAGSRAARLTKQREAQQQEYELKKKDIQSTNQRSVTIDSLFESHRDLDDEEFKVRTLFMIETY